MAAESSGYAFAQRGIAVNAAAAAAPWRKVRRSACGSFLVLEFAVFAMKSSANGLLLDPRRENYTTTSNTEPRTSSRRAGLPSSQPFAAERPKTRPGTR